MEITDLFLDAAKHDALIARAARLAGAEAMRLAVLEWAYSFRDALSTEMLDALYERMLKRVGELRDGTRQAEGEGR